MRLWDMDDHYRITVNSKTKAEYLPHKNLTT